LLPRHPSPCSSRCGLTASSAISLSRADGSFVLEGLVGDHCLLLYGMPHGWRLQRITHQGRDVTGVPMMFELGQEVGPVIFWVEAGPQSGDANSSCAR
jgi:hypothetical protein